MGTMMKALPRGVPRIAAAVLAACAALSGCGSTSSSSAPAPYLLVLGDSLSTGYQPGVTGDQLCAHPKIDARGHGGWACILLKKLRATNSAYQIANLAVNSEDTCGFMTGTTCGGNPIGGSVSQQKQAARFIRSHPGSVGLITLDIGADDAAVLEAEIRAGNATQVVTDLPTVFARAERNYRRILKRIRTLAPGVPIMALGYYVPNLPSVVPKDLRGLAESYLENLAQEFNANVIAAANATKATYVNLYTPFLGKRAQLLVPGDIHPNDAGQRLIAKLVWRAYRARGSTTGAHA